MNSATYSPEDNKLRLYVGRVPRDEYEALRAEGWTSTPKQSCDFVAVWTPERRDRALSYADIIEDEDQGPAERAADRAERFAEYRDKRTDEATGAADRFDAGPAAHGYQSQARAERSAARHDRIAGRACDAWSKAEYWQRRTAGVISHALHLSAPSVRMGRIKTLETELRGLLARWKDSTQPMTERALDWKTHLELRLAYENQMMQAQGGRAGAIEMEPAGLWRGGVIAKINRSSATGRVVSVAIIGPAVTEWTYKAANVPGTPFALYQFDAERAAPGSYQPPTDESRAKFAAFEAAKQAAAKKRKETAPPCPLVNPTDADAERLQALWNVRTMAKGTARQAKDKYAYCPEIEGEQSTVLRITQAVYSQNSGATYSSAQTIEVEAGGTPRTGYRGQYKGQVACKVRVGKGESYKSPRVIIITDKPQKPFPAALWETEKPAAPAFALELCDASTP